MYRNAETHSLYAYFPQKPRALAVAFRPEGAFFASVSLCSMI